MERRISVVMAADEPCAAALFVTIASLLENLRRGVGLELYVMDSGLTAETRRKLETAWDDRVRLHWAPLDDSKLESLRGYGHTSAPAAYFRLLVGSALPGDVSRVIYLDADLLIRRDVFELWGQDMRGKIVLAVQDSYIQRPTARSPSAREQPEVEQPYFNSGVMVIDLDAWRAAGVEQDCLEAASRLTYRTKWLDQHLLNVSMTGRWGSLPPTWNKQYSLDLFPDWRCSPYREDEFQEARCNPAITHFCTRTKPWHPFCDHRGQDVLAYRATLRRTGLGNGPEPAPSLLRRSVEFFAAPHRRLLDTTAAALHASQRQHALHAMLPDMFKLAMLHPWTLVTVPLSIVRERVAIRLGI